MFHLQCKTTAHWSALSVLGVVIGRRLFSATWDRLGGPVALVWMKFPLVAVVRPSGPPTRNQVTVVCASDLQMRLPCPSGSVIMLPLLVSSSSWYMNVGTPVMSVPFHLMVTTHINQLKVTQQGLSYYIQLTIYAPFLLTLTLHW